jgi:DNA-binding NarL/FixJ family response regulator
MSSRPQRNKQTVNPPTLMEAYRRLSSSEGRVLEKIRQGKSNRQIGLELHISTKTVENHITRIGKKLNLSGRGAIRKWLRNRSL